METIIHNLIILDESGSMAIIKSQAIGGFNETVQTIKLAEEQHPEQKHTVSLVTFNGGGMKTIYDKLPVSEVTELNDEIYSPNYSTPLFDTMGFSLTSLNEFVKPEDKVLITIITDGEENSSKEYNGAAIKKLIDELKLKGWVFVYIGANHDVEKFADSISINNRMSFASTPEGTEFMHAQINQKRAVFYDRVSEKESSEMLNDFFQDDGKQKESSSETQQKDSIKDSEQKPSKKGFWSNLQKTLSGKS